MQTNAFASLAVLQFSSPCRLLSSSCCPDKDLLILISRLGGQDRVSLWNSTQGAKIWEVDIGDENSGATVVDIAWSPDGMGRCIPLPKYLFT
jgi:anaphase-promoting complex subunit 4